MRKQYLEKMEPTLTNEQFAQLKKMREPGTTRGAQGARSQGERPGAGGDQKPQ